MRLMEDAEVRAHFHEDDGYDERLLQIVVTDEGVIFDTYLNDELVGTFAILAGDLFETICLGGLV